MMDYGDLIKMAKILLLLGKIAYNDCLFCWAFALIKNHLNTMK